MPYEFLDEVPETQPEGWVGTGVRTGLRTMARGAEAVAGLPGDILSGVMGLGSYATGGIIPSMEKIQEKLPFVAPPPTSEQIRERGTKKYTGQYLEPQSPTEEGMDVLAGDIATLLLPVKGKIPFKSALLKAGAGNLAGWLTEAVTGSPVAGATAKMGAMALAGTAGGRREITRLKDQSYKQAFEKLAPTATVNIEPEAKAVNNLISKVSKSDMPNKNFILERLGTFPTDTSTTNLADLIDLKQNWNEFLADPEITGKSRNYIKLLVGQANKAIDRFGHANPEFYKPYRVAEELHGALNSTNFVQKLISQHPKLQQSIKTPWLRNLFLVGGPIAYMTGFAKPAAVTAGALYGINEGAKFYELLSKSPVARKYYGNLITNSFKQNVPAMARDLSKLDLAATKLDKQHQQEQPGGRYEFLD